MKHSNLIALAILFSVNASAAVPQVSCAPAYNLTNADGSSLDYVRSAAVAMVPGKPLEIQVKGFTFKASLREICAMDGGPCTGTYEFSSSITKGEVSTYTSTHSDRSPFLQLQVGREQFYVNCYFEEKSEE